MAVTVPRRSFGWGVYFTVLGWLLIPVGLVSMHSGKIISGINYHAARQELKREDLSSVRRAALEQLAKDASKRVDEKSFLSHFDSLHMQYGILPLAGSLLLLGRRLRRPDPARVIEADTRPPVLYLRSFRDDGKEADILMSASSLKSQTAEEQLERLLQKTVGPVLAIGKPGEVLAQIGAARVYVEDERWQEVVGRLMQAASLVVLRMGDTPGILWELERVRREVPPEKVLLLLPFSDWQSYEAVEQKVFSCLGLNPPSQGEVAQVLYFSPEWKARARRASPQPPAVPRPQRQAGRWGRLWHVLNKPLLESSPPPGRRAPAQTLEAEFNQVLKARWIPGTKPLTPWQLNWPARAAGPVTTLPGAGATIPIAPARPSPRIGPGGDPLDIPRSCSVGKGSNPRSSGRGTLCRNQPGPGPVLCGLALRPRAAVVAHDCLQSGDGTSSLLQCFFDTRRPHRERDQ